MKHKKVILNSFYSNISKKTCNNILLYKVFCRKQSEMWAWVDCRPNNRLHFFCCTQIWIQIQSIFVSSVNNYGFKKEKIFIGMCYKILQKNMDWYTAQKECLALNKDANLAEIKSKEENYFIKCKLNLMLI